MVPETATVPLTVEVPVVVTVPVIVVEASVTGRDADDGLIVTGSAGSAATAAVETLRGALFVPSVMRLRWVPPVRTASVASDALVTATEPVIVVEASVTAGVPLMLTLGVPLIVVDQGAPPC